VTEAPTALLDDGEWLTSLVGERQAFGDDQPRGFDADRLDGDPALVYWGCVADSFGSDGLAVRVGSPGSAEGVVFAEGAGMGH
jgi:hypothetical protein